MKKINFLIIIFCLVIINTGCIKRDSMEDITINTTVYPITFIANTLYNENATINNPSDFLISFKFSRLVDFGTIFLIK